MISLLYAIVIEPLVLVIELIYSLLYRVLGDPGPAILGLSVAVSTLLLPLYARADALQQEERDKQARMAHWVNHIKTHFSGDEQYMVLSTYYRQQHYSQLSQLRGSISLLLQVPFFIAAYRYLSGLQALSGMSFGPISDLSRPDGLISLGSMTVNVLPIAMTLLNVASSAVYTRGLAFRDKLQTYALAALFLILLYQSPSGLVLYWTCNQVFSLAKNIFTRMLRTPERDLAISTTILLVAFGAWLILSGRLLSLRRKLVFALLALVLETLVLLPLFKRKSTVSGRHTKNDAAHGDTPNQLFILTALCLTALMGLVIPSALIGSSPADFINIYDYVNPLSSIGHTLLVSLGLFVLWGSVYYALSDATGRRMLAGLFVLVCGVAVVDFFFFGRDLGVIDNNLVYPSELTYLPQESRTNLIALCAISLVLIVIFVLRPRLLQPVMGVLALALVAVSMPNLQTTKQMADTKRAEADAFLARTGSDSSSLFSADGSIQPISHISRDGRNVIVLFVDMAEARFIPYIMEEHPELVDQYDGFTFYPNTISCGGHTIMSAPSIYGGYEYTLEAINARTDKTVEEDTAESLQVLPAAFNNEGFDVTVTDEPRFSWDESYAENPIYDSYEHIREYELIGVYANYGTYSSKLGSFSTTIRESFLRNLFFYSVFKSAPVITQPIIYDDGHYYSTLVNHSINDQYVNNYSVLANMDSLVEVVDDASDNALIMHNKLPHSPQVLQLPDYTLSLYVSEHDLQNNTRLAPGQEPLVLDTESKLGYYHAEMAMCLALGSWFDELRAAGVWDNTRIIIVSDHGSRWTYFPDFTYNDLNLGKINALLMVKDFGASGFRTSDEFMTCADIPSLSLASIVDNPVNPLTDNPITMDGKLQPQVVTSSSHQAPKHHPGTSYDTSDGHLYSISNSIFDQSNFKQLD